MFIQNRLWRRLTALAWILLFPLTSQAGVYDSQKVKVGDLIRQGKLDQAARVIEKNQMIFGRKRLQRYYILLGNAYMDTGKDMKAIACFQRVPYRRKKIDRTIKQLARIVGRRFLLERDYRQALKYYRLNGDKELIGKLASLKAGDDHFREKRYEKAMAAYIQSGFWDRMAGAYAFLGDIYVKKGQIEKGKSHYRRAVESYQKILKSFEYQWGDHYNKKRLNCIEKLAKLKKSREDVSADKRLKRILKGVGDYCQRLKSESFFFYCDEYVSKFKDFYIWEGESQPKGVYFSRDWSGRPPSAQPGKHKKNGIERRKYVYSYQLVQDGDHIKETRKLYRNKLDGRKSQQKDEWGGDTVFFKKIIFGPIGLLSHSWQSHYDYHIIGEERLAGRNAVIIDCIPKNPFDNSNDNLLFGKVWVDEEQMNILKIVWEPKAVAIATEFVRYARRFSKTPDTRFITVFLQEGDGIRYPSKGIYAEYFVGTKQNRQALLKLDILYKNHRFFDVNTDTKMRPDESTEDHENG